MRHLKRPKHCNTHFHLKAERGFTLIELLVVISIISLISSVIFAGLNSARDKARIAVGQQFSTSVHSILGLSGKAVWSFEEPGTSPVKDLSGNGYSGVLSNGAAQVGESECDLGLGGCLKLDGVNDLMDSTSGINFGGSDKLTMMLWMKNSSAKITTKTAIIYKLTAVFEIFVADNGKIHLWANNGVWHKVLETPQYVNWDEWHHIAVVYDGSTMKIYRDGELVRESGTETGNLRSHTGVVRIGQASSAAARWNGYIDEVRFYQEAFTAEAIGKLYASEAPRYQVAVQ